MLVAIAVAGLVVIWRAVDTARSLDDAALQVEARALARHLTTGPDGRPALDLPASMRAALRQSDDDSLFVVTDAANHVLLSSDPESAARVAPFLPSQPGVFRAPPDSRHSHGVVGAVVSAGPWRLAIVQGREKGEALASSLFPSLLASGLIALAPIGVATVLIGIATVRYGLRPLRELSAAAASISPAQPGARLSVERLPGEAKPLVEAMNAALARLETALDGQRRFVGEAAHTLRTPLAVLTARLYALPEMPEVAALTQDVARMARLVDQMLKMARIESVPLDVSRPVMLRQVAVEAISLLAPVALRRRIELMLTETGPAPPVRGHHATLVIALTNLIENALAHAPPNTAVEVLIAPPATVAVLDRGPGVPEASRTRIFSRFVRGERAHANGAGLGLAIVAEIVAAHGGRVWVDAREGGGAAFVMDLSGARLGTPRR